MSAARPFMPHLGPAAEPLLYALALLALAAGLFGAARLLRALGVSPREALSALREAARRAPWLRNLARYALLQKKTSETTAGGVIHGPIFFGFLALFFGTCLVALDHHLAPGRILTGAFYAVFEAALDAAGLALILGCLGALLRRAALRPSHLHSSRADWWVLSALLFVAVSGFAVEAARIAVGPAPAARWSFAGNAITGFAAGLSPETLLPLYTGLWWVHAVSALAFLAVIPFVKLRHMALVPANLVFSPPRETPEKAAVVTPVNILAALESNDEAALDAASRLGLPDTSALAFPRRLSILACMNCGRCEAACPATASGRALSPRKVAQTLAGAILASSDAPFCPERVTPEEMWGCTACGACMEVCPAFIRHADHLLDLRRAIVSGGLADPSRAAVFSNIERAGNPFGLPSASRPAWLFARAAARAAPRPEYLYFVGCSSTCDARCARIPEALIALLDAAGVTFATLGPREACCGEPARRMGEEGLFQMQAARNIEAIRDAGASRVLVHCPHCLNTLKYQYPDFGGSFEVIHHSELLAGLLRSGRLPLRDSPAAAPPFAYHDPCTLGRLLGLFDPPRWALGASGAPVLELPQNRAASFCCGGGGGGAFHEVPQREKPASLRLREAASLDVSTLASACPFCLMMFEDARKAAGDAGDALPRPLDIAEILAARLEKP